MTVDDGASDWHAASAARTPVVPARHATRRVVRRHNARTHRPRGEVLSPLFVSVAAIVASVPGCGIACIRFDRRGAIWIAAVRRAFERLRVDEMRDRRR